MIEPKLSGLSRDLTGFRKPVQVFVQVFFHSLKITNFIEDQYGMYNTFKHLRDFLEYAHENTAVYFDNWE